MMTDTLPAVRPERSECAAPARPRPVLWLVDDSQNFRSLLAELLAGEAGFDCARQFSSPTEVLAALAAETPPDLILLDIQMGAECGLDALGPIRRRAPGTHVVMLTTCADGESRRRARAGGATDFLLKSFSLGEIASRLSEALTSPLPSPPPAPSAAVPTSTGHVFAKRNDEGHWFTEWKALTSRLARGTFAVRSLLSVLF